MTLSTKYTCQVARYFFFIKKQVFEIFLFLDFNNKQTLDIDFHSNRCLIVSLFQKKDLTKIITLMVLILDVVLMFVTLTLISSIGHPFLGDYVRLRQNPQWKKICTESNDQYVVFADIINKITRSGGKVMF